MNDIKRAKQGTLDIQLHDLLGRKAANDIETAALRNERQNIDAEMLRLILRDRGGRLTDCLSINWSRLERLR